MPAADLQRGIDRLRQDGVVRVHTDVLGHHRAFIGAVLATLPGASVTREPARITLATTIPADQLVLLSAWTSASCARDGATIGLMSQVSDRRRTSGEADHQHP